MEPILAGLNASTATAPRQTAPAAAEAAKGFTDVLRAAEEQAQAALTTGGDPHSLVTAMAESKLAVETVVAIRDKAVEAYQEILRMPV
jgi:flagellar hook-basal body complex protein FliE